jgi:hypothetical protein
MDCLTFISKIIDTLAWPIVAITLLSIIRKELPGIITSLKTLKFKGLELEFAKDAAALAEEAKRTIPPVERPQREEERDSSRLLQLADISSRAAILEAWLLVETSAATCLQKYRKTVKSAYQGPLQLLNGLISEGVLTPPQVNTFQHLRKLRNDAVHIPDAEFTRDAVTNYIQSALVMTAYLQDITESTIRSEP